MTIARGLAVIIACAVGFGAGGGIIGLALGVTMPGYYRGVFLSGRDPAFRSVQVGVGLGTGQGAICGVVVGSALVIARTLAGHRSQDPEFARPGSRPRWVWRLAGALMLLVALASSGAIGFVLGAVIGQVQLYQRIGEERAARVRPVLEDPAFQTIRIEISSLGEVYLFGSVPTEADRTRLLERLRFLVGDRDARDAVSSVDVERK
ncbi:MAG: hypothetical protein ACYC61_05350 [Isosphaeraceae bacterium]